MKQNSQKLSLVIGGMLIVAVLLGALLPLFKPKQPGFALVGQIDSANWNALGLVDVIGDYLYVPVGHDGVRVVNIGNLPQWDEVAAFTVPPFQGEAVKIVIRDPYAYIAATTSLAIYDVTNPEQPALVGTWNEREVWDIEVADGIVYVMSRGALFVVDVSDPRQPQTIGDPEYYFIGSDSSNQVVTRDHLLFVNTSSQRKIFDATDSGQLQELSSFEVIFQDIPLFTYGFALAHPYLYVIGEYERHYVMDVSDPQQPRQIGQFVLPGMMVVSGHYGFGSFRLDLQMLDLTNPVSPVKLASYNLGDGVRDMAFVGNRLYVTGLRSGAVMVLDVQLE